MISSDLGQLIELIDKNDNESEQLDEIICDVRKLIEIQDSLCELIVSQNEDIITVQSKLENVDETIIIGTDHLYNAMEDNNKYKYKKSLLITTGFCVVSFPVGFIVGVKIGIATGLFGIGCGSVSYVT
jgi:hypothetical protein